MLTIHRRNLKRVLSEKLLCAVHTAILSEVSIPVDLPPRMIVSFYLTVFVDKPRNSGRVNVGAVKSDPSRPPIKSTLYAGWARDLARTEPGSYLSREVSTRQRLRGATNYPR